MNPSNQSPNGPFGTRAFAPGLWLVVGDTATRQSRSRRLGATRSIAPFAWQYGQRLLLLDHELSGDWVLAELWFDQAQCGYVEVRRAHYRWEREAVGAFLSLALACGERPAQESAELLRAWLATHHAGQPTA